jgi:predicted RNase H-like nuclease (RuvC/YqgF family)
MLPQIHLNGNMKTWIAFFSFFGAVIAISVGAGQWIAGRAPVTAVEALADSIGTFRREMKSLNLDLVEDQQEMTASLHDVKGKVEDVEVQIVSLDAGLTKVRSYVMKLATQAWVMDQYKSLREESEALHTENAQLRERIQKLEKELEKQKEKKGRR